MTLRSPGKIRAIASLEHQALDAGFPRPGPKTLELLDRREAEHGGTLGARRPRARMPGFEPRASLHEGQGTQVLLALEQHVVQTDLGGMRFQHRRRDGLPVEPLLQIVEGRDLALSYH